MQKKQMHSFQKEQKTQSGRDFRKEKGGYVKFDPAEAKKLLEEGMKEQGWSTLPEVTLKFTTDTQHKKSKQKQCKKCLRKILA